MVARAVRRQLALLMPRRAGVARAPRGEFAAGIVGLRTELRRAKERPVSVGIDVQDAEVVVVPAHDARVDVPPLAPGPARDVPCARSVLGPGLVSFADDVEDERTPRRIEAHALDVGVEPLVPVPEDERRVLARFDGESDGRAGGRLPRRAEVVRFEVVDVGSVVERLRTPVAGMAVERDADFPGRRLP